MAADERPSFEAPGLMADWLNAWLAAIGVTVLLPRVKLSWTDEIVPHAVFLLPDEDYDLATEIASALPSATDLESLPIARTHARSEAEFPRTVSIESFRDRARLERAQGTCILAACNTDLRDRDLERLPDSPFNPPAPRGVTLWERVVACRAAVDGPAQVSATLNGTAERLSGNGLGFDPRRAATGVPPGGADFLRIDPVVELLAFEALSLFPIRGDGRRAQTRGWTGPSSRRHSFVWFSWNEPLDRYAIDAALDQPAVVARRRWGVVPYLSTGNDVTKRYFSEPIE